MTIEEQNQQEHLAAKTQITNYESFLIALHLYWNYPVMTADERRALAESWKGHISELKNMSVGSTGFPSAFDPLWIANLQATGAISAINMSATV